MNWPFVACNHGVHAADACARRQDESRHAGRRSHDIACNTLPCSFTRKGLLPHRERIEVPGLSAEALAAIAPLQRSDFLRRTLRDVPVKLLTADEIASAAGVASVWSAIQANEPVRAELARFRQAVDERLGGRPYTGSDPAAAGRVSVLAGLLAQAERLTARHAAVQAAREAEQREAERQRVAEQNRAQAEIERMLDQWQKRRPRARPRPSSGPGMG